MNIKILVCYHKKDRLYKNDVLFPIHGGRALAADAVREGRMSEEDYRWMLENTTGDDTGADCAQISRLNSEINEWTAMYWAWKNYEKLGNPDFIGLMHYRRLFDFSPAWKKFSPDVIKRFGLYPENLSKVFARYDFVHNKGFWIDNKIEHSFEPYEPAVGLSESYHPLLYKYQNRFKEEQFFYYANMFIMKKDDFFAMCQEIFPVIFDLMKKPKDKVMSYWLDWLKRNLEEKFGKRYSELVAQYRDNNNWFPRHTGFAAEYLSSFYFAYLKDRYGDRALGVPVRLIEKRPLSYYLKNKLFSIRNEYIEHNTYKTFTLMGLRIVKIRKYS